VATLEESVEAASAYWRLEESCAHSRMICTVGIRCMSAASTWLITSDEHRSFADILLEAEVDDLLQGAVIRGQQLRIAVGVEQEFGVAIRFAQASLGICRQVLHAVQDVLGEILVSNVNIHR